MPTMQVKEVMVDALDFDLMVDTLRKLKEGKHVEVCYNRLCMCLIVDQNKCMCYG